MPPGKPSSKADATFPAGAVATLHPPQLLSGASARNIALVQCGNNNVLGRVLPGNICLKKKRSSQVNNRRTGEVRRLLPETSLVGLFTGLLAAALARQCFLHALLLARLQVKRVPLDLFNNVLLLHFTLEPAQGVL